MPDDVAQIEQEAKPTSVAESSTRGSSVGVSEQLQPKAPQAEAKPVDPRVEAEASERRMRTHRQTFVVASGGMFLLLAGVDAMYDPFVATHYFFATTGAALQALGVSGVLPNLLPRLGGDK